MKAVLFLFVILISAVATGQTENVFLDRSYWKSNPSLKQVKEDILKGNDPSAFNQHKFDAVTWASIEDVDDETIIFLIEQEGNDINKRSHDGRTPIFWAAYRGDLELMRKMVDLGAKTDLLDSHGFSVVNFAANSGQTDVELYEFCVEHGAILAEEFNNSKATPLLLIAPHVDNVAILEYFEAAGLKITQVDNDGNNAFVYAARSGNKFMMDYCISRGLDPKANNHAAVIFAAKGTRGGKQDISTFEYLSEKGVQLTARDKSGHGVLYYLAGGSKDHDLLAFVIEKTQPSLSEKDKNDILFNAIQRNDLQTIQFLNEKLKFDLSGKNEENNTILHVSVERGYPQLVDWIITSKETSIDELNMDGYSALQIAAMRNENIEILATLIEAGADKNIESEFGETAYMLAIENEKINSNLEALEFLK